MKTRTDRFTVDPAHPSLAGHFPGNPVLPGVVVLDQVIRAAERWLGPAVEVIALPQVKFVSPLRPGDTADVSLRYRPPTLEFAVVTSRACVARGALRIQVRGARDG